MAAYESLKTKEKSSRGIPNVVAVTYEVYVTVQTGFHTWVVTRVGRLREWS